MRPAGAALRRPVRGVVHPLPGRAGALPYRRRNNSSPTWLTPSIGVTARSACILTLRADFLDRCLALPDLRKMLEDRQVLLGPMDEPALREAITCPTMEVGAFFEKGLVSMILRDVGNEPGYLPLLEHALYELWQARGGPWLTMDAYEASGGVAGALQRRAQSTYEALTPEQQSIARGIFLRLAALGEGVADTRCRVPRNELYPLGIDPAQVDAVLQALSGERARLVVADEESVEMAHEALIQHWPTLRKWLEENRDALHLQRRLADTAKEWQRQGCNDGDLYRDARLTEANKWAARHAGEVNSLEHKFLAASQAAQNQRVRQRRWRRILAGSAAAAIFILIAAVLVINSVRLGELSRQDRASAATAQALAFTAQTESARALTAERAEIVRAEEAVNARATADARLQEVERQQRIALARRLSTQVDTIIAQEHDPELSLLIALEAAKTTQDVGLPQTEEAYRTLQNALGAAPLAVLRHEGDVKDFAFGPDGKWLATLTGDTVHLWDSGSGEEITTLHQQSESDEITFSPNGTRLATNSSEAFHLWDIANRKVLLALDHGVQIAFSPDGAGLATGEQWSNTIRTWDMRTGAESRPLDCQGGADLIVYSPDGRWLAAESGSIVRLWNASNGKLMSNFKHAASVGAVVFSPDGARLATESDGIIHLWDIATGAESATLDSGALRGSGSSSTAAYLRFSPDGTRLAVYSWGGYKNTISTGPARLWDANSGHEVSILGEGVVDVIFSPDGMRFATVTADDAARLWDAQNGTALFDLRSTEPIGDVVFSPNGTELLTTSRTHQGLYEYTTDGPTRLWDSRSGQELRALASGGRVANRGVFRPDGERLATMTGDTVYLWSTVGGAEPMTLRIKDVGDEMAFSPDGSTLATQSNRAVDLWNVNDGEKTFTLIHEDPVEDVVFSPNGTTLATKSGSLIRLWNARDGKGLQVLDPEVNVKTIAFSPDGGRLAVLGGTNSVHLWDTNLNKVLLTLNSKDGIDHLSFNSDGTRLAVESDSAARLVEASTGKELLASEKNWGWDSASVFTPDERDWLYGMITPSPCGTLATARSCCP